jgi:hypothetical protein
MSYSRLLINHIAKILFVLAVLNVKISAQQDTTANDSSKDTVFVMQKSPWTAVLLSAVIPGAGQIYNESYWKAPVIWGISGWLIYNWIDLNKSYKYYGDLYEQTGNDYYKELRGNYRDERDLFTIYMILTYILNLVDAYVDAQLFDFNVDESIGKLQPEIRFRLKF